MTKPELTLAPTKANVGFAKCPECRAQIAIRLDEYNGRTAITCASCGFHGIHDLRLHHEGP